MKKYINLFILILITVCTNILSVSGDSLAPDRSQQVLDLLAVECQKINDFYFMAQYGDTSSFSSVKEHISVTINNISILLNGYDNYTVNTLWNMYNQFMPDAQSAQNAAELCSTVRGELYRKISNDPQLNNPNRTLNNFDDCRAAGYHVNGGTCFIGGSPVYDENGYLIGFYYSDCFDSTGFHMGSCWDCFYGADQDGCIKKP